jgi:hypothetical protein
MMKDRRGREDICEEGVAAIDGEVDVLRGLGVL